MPDISKIFKAYDVRGLSPQELDEDVAYRIGQALVKFTEAKVVVAGRDMRDTSPSLFESFSHGVMSQGADLIDIGMITTPMLYFAVGEYELHDAGAVITASHNPKEYNGVKMCYGDVLPIGADSGMYDIRDIVLAGPLPLEEEGTVVTTDIKDAYLEMLFSKADVKSIKPLKVVVDNGNGMESLVLEDIFKEVPQVEMTPLYLEMDGSFPNHEANPLKEETLVDLKAKMKEVGADLGFAFDGDGDRVGLVDEKGETVRGDMIVGLLAPRLLEGEEKGTAVLYDVRESMAVVEEIEKAGGRAVMSRVGHGLIKPQMKEEEAVFAGELSNHFYFRDFFNAESSDLVMLLIMEMVSKSGKPLSELVAPLKRYHHSGEINSEVEDKQGVMDRLEKEYGPKGEVTKIDGIRIDFKDPDDPDGDWWFNVRPSNTEPLLRLNLETKSAEKTERMKEELLAKIRE